MQGIGNVAHREHARTGCFHIAVNDKIALGVLLESKIEHPGLVAVGAIAKQQDDVVHFDTIAVIQS